MAQAQPTTVINEPIPAIVRVGRPPKATKQPGGAPMPPDLEESKWTEQALKVLHERYLLKNDLGEVVETPSQMCWRVAWDIASAEIKFGRGYEEVLKVAKEFYEMLSKHHFLPNSPTLMNAGKGNGLQYNGCFVIPVEDSIEGIFDGIKYAAIIHKSGGGTGFAFSRLRSSGARVGSTKGVASGPVSFLKVYDAATEQIKQGGSRRGANMGVLRIDHPDVLEFIHCKEDGGITNFNISLATTDAFMRAYFDDKDYDLVDPKTKKITGQLSARKVMDEIADGAWKTGDPGMIFIDKINAGSANPVPSLGPIETTNPCVTGDTWVSTKTGLVKIKKLVDKATNVLTDGRLARNEWQRTTQVIRTGIKEVFLLKTKEGFRVELTADHKVMTNLGWKEAKDLKKGEKILLADRKGGFGFEGNLELGRILGWLVGDGTMKAAESVLSFFGSEKQELAPVFASMVTKATEGMGLRGNSSQSVGVIEVKGRDEARVKSMKLWRLAVDWGITKEEKLVVPERLFGAGEEMQKGFLQALFTADGHVEGNVEKGVTVRLTSISESLLVDVQRVLLNFGIVSKINTFRRKAMKRSLPDGQGGYRNYNCQAYHDLAVSKENLWKFASEIGFLSEYKNIKLLEALRRYKEGPYKERFEATFLSLESLGMDEVFDLTEPKSHSFVANGIVVHNCGEQPLYPFDACNLGSIFLTYFVKEENGKQVIDWNALEKTTKMAVRFLDNVIERNPIPLQQIKDMVDKIRRIGLGVGGWADMLILMDIPYDSEEAVVLAEKIMKFINNKGHEASEELAVERGSFPLWSESIYKDGKQIRNATVTTIAPTGTIGHLAGTSQGIEPIFAIAYKHYVKTNALERSLYYFNNLFEEMYGREPWFTSEVKEKIAEQGTIAHIEEIPEKVRKLFVTAHDISPEWHVRTQAAFQKYTDNAVSKTINMPNSSTAEDIKKAYVQAYETGCQGITVYRDGSKSIQVLNLGTKDKKEEQASTTTNGHQKIEMASLRPRPEKLSGSTYRILTPVGHAFITVNSTEAGDPFEVFLAVGHAGSEVAADAEAIGRLVSMSLRIPSALSPNEISSQVVDQLRGIGGASSVGFGMNRVKSLADAVAKILDSHLKNDVLAADAETAPVELSRFQTALPLTVKKDLCPSCGAAAFVYEEGCAKCHACGFAKC